MKLKGNVEPYLESEPAAEGSAEHLKALAKKSDVF
jgi:hypothetical protein